MTKQEKLEAAHKAWGAAGIWESDGSAHGRVTFSPSIERSLAAEREREESERQVKAEVEKLLREEKEANARAYAKLYPSIDAFSSSLPPPLPPLPEPRTSDRHAIPPWMMFALGALTATLLLEMARPRPSAATG